MLSSEAAARQSPFLLNPYAAQKDSYSLLVIAPRHG
jgi:hypothetical protein